MASRDGKMETTVRHDTTSGGDPIIAGTSDSRAKGQGRRGRRSKGLSEEQLYQSALYYLGRYAASSASVRRVLDRRVAKYAQDDGVDPETASGWIDAIIGRLTRSGILDDRTFADARARTLFNRGLSIRMIEVKLAEKGLERPEVEQAVEALLEEHRDPDLQAAITLVRRRRLGPFRAEAQREAAFQRDLAALARAGFAFDIARLVLAAPTVEDLRDLDRGR